jgi:hypothetical protein
MEVGFDYATFLGFRVSDLELRDLGFKFRTQITTSFYNA